MKSVTTKLVHVIAPATGQECVGTNEHTGAPVRANGEIGYERNVAQKRDTRDTDDEQAKILVYFYVALVNVCVSRWLAGLELLACE